MEFPQDLYYTETHEWLRVKDGEVTVGITSYAQEQLRDVVFIELPRVGKKVKAKDPCAVIESVKAAFDIYAPLSGTITGVNKELEGQPELVNKDPYGLGWMFVLKMEDLTQLQTLLNAQAYASIIKEGH
ncbi:MAG: glycine cleavage system protein GcvH [Candidatus Brocadiaceae bacterium]|nr:glycine cleavage system protein GcvH [Candidatus Brocadiaceae bacterium]